MFPYPTLDRQSLIASSQNGVPLRPFFGQKGPSCPWAIGRGVQLIAAFRANSLFQPFRANGLRSAAERQLSSATRRPFPSLRRNSEKKELGHRGVRSLREVAGGPIAPQPAADERKLASLLRITLDLDPASVKRWLSSPLPALADAF